MVAIIVYPAVAALLGVSDFAFGVFAGTAIHSTPQVVGAGFIFSEEAGNTATAVKLVRNCFMLPLAFCIGAWATKRALQTQNGITGRKSLAKAFPWFLFGYFIMATANTLGYLSPEQVELLAGAGKFLILAGMAGVGLNTAFTAFRSIGLKPLIVGLCGSLVVAATSAALVVSTGLI